MGGGGEKDGLVHTVYTCADFSQDISLIFSILNYTPPTHTPTQNDLLVAVHMVYLVLLLVQLFRYADEQSTL